MSQRFYHMSRRYMGREVTIRCRDGAVRHGRIMRVTPTHVYLTPISRTISDHEGKITKDLAKTAESRSSQEEGEEIQFFFPFAIPLAAILGITLIAAAAARPRFFRRSPFFW